MMYRIGMYGGKFCPMHIGHRYVLERAMKECDTLHVFLFVNTLPERVCRKWFTNPSFRYYQIVSNVERIKEQNFLRTNVKVHVMDSEQFKTNGVENWYAEAGYMKGLIEPEHFDAVYSSEPSYDQFFKSCYPEAEHVLVDPKKEVNRISSSILRTLDDTDEELMRWIA